MRRIAVIGSGVSGLTAAHLLARQDHVTLYEAEPRLGGHAHTHTVNGVGGQRIRVDSGFIVHNDRTYPHLLRLFDELGVRTRDTEMSLSVSDPVTGIEYAGGRGIRGFLGRPRQLLDRSYLSMLREVRRFHRVASEFLATTDDLDETTYGDFIVAHGFSSSFTELYAVPLVACVWSSGRGAALGYPVRYLFRFLDHHGMLTVTGSPQWRTVVGGSATYVDAIAERLQEVRVGRPVRSVTRHDDGVRITDASGAVDHHDAVVVATHADDALALLADASPLEKEVLGAFTYSTNRTVLHRDGSLMPSARWTRSSWNYRVATDDSTGGCVVTYWMNRLQGLPEDSPLYVTLNATDEIDPALVIATMDYRHPIYDLKAVSAQRQLPELATDRTVFAGAHHGWGFHEDGCRSGVEAAARLGASW